MLLYKQRYFLFILPISRRLNDERELNMQKYILKNKKVIFILSIGTLITSLMTMVVPIILSFFKKSELAVFDYTLLIFITVLTFLSFIIQCVVILIREKISVKMNIHNSYELYEKAFRLKYTNYIKMGATYLLDRISMTTNALYLFICTTLTSIIANIFIALFSLALVAYYNIYLGLLLLLVIPINFFGFKALNKELKNRSMKMQKNTSEGYQHILAVMSNPDFIKQYRDDAFIQSYLKNELFKIFNSMKEVNVFAQCTSTFLRFINLYIQSVTVFVISYDVYTKQLGIVPILVVSIVLPLFFQAVSSVTSANISTYDVKSGLQFVEEELEDSQLEIFGNEKLNEIRNIAIIENNAHHFENIFTFDGDKSFEKGDIVYVSGESGSGKSTLLRAIAGVIENDYICYNDKKISTYFSAHLKEKIVFVPQEATILPISITDNLKVGNQSKSVRFEVKGIAENRLDDVVFEGGKNLSGGEKQRISLARAIYAHPEVLLLDEITSNIDEASEDCIFEDIVKYSKKSIIFVTSHNKKIKSICNKEVKVKKGGEGDK